MGTGYTRQSAADIITGANITAAPLNAEFNAIQAAYDSTTGHSHDGTSGEGPLIDLTTSITGQLPAANGGFGVLHKVDATTAPTATDDTGSGYGAGSFWIDITNDVAYVCLDGTSTAAVWYRISYPSTVAAIGALTPTDGNIIVGNGSTWVAESGATARTSLGLGTGDSPQFTAIELGNASDTTIARVSAGVVSIEGSNILLASGLGSITQAYSANTAAIAALAVTDGNIIVGNGSTWVAESGGTARTSLGLAIGTDVQGYSANLAAIAALTSAANKVPMFSGSGTATLLDFYDEDTMSSNSATGVASQQSIKAYVDSQVGGVGFALGDLSDVTITAIASGEIIKWNGSAYINNTLTEAGIQDILAEGAFVDGDKTKLDGIETGADVTDATNVAAAGAVMTGSTPVTEQADAVWEAGTGTTASIVAPDAIAAAIAALAGGGGGLNSVQVFTTSGTWTRPSGVTKVLMFVTGGGGGGQAGAAGGHSGAGGEAGGTAIKFLDVSSIASSTITIGAGGSGGTGAGGDGVDGGDSSWADGTNTITGAGGDRGDDGGTSQGIGGSGEGTATNGDLNVPGGDGADGLASTGTAVGGNGGASFWGGGGKGSYTGNIDAENADAYGAGGGGGGSSSSLDGNGGAGKAGVVFVVEFV